MIATFKTLNLPLRLLGLILVALFFFVLARIVVALTNPESLWTQSVINAPTATRPASASQRFVFSTDPFNRESPSVVIEEEVIIGADVPETTLNLKMTGRMASETGTAILKTADNKEAVYKIGDEIISDVFLKAVNKDFVVLEVNGQLQRLTFERDEAGELTKKAVAPAPVNKRSAIHRSVNTSRNAKQDFADDILMLLETINFRKSVKDGQIQGFTVKSNKPSFDLKLFGFQKGDIVTHLNDTDLRADGIDFLSLFQDSAQAGDVAITILRNGQNKKIKLGAN